MEAKTKHTPGPFTVRGAEVYGADGYHVASTDSVHLKRGWKAKSGQHWGTTPGATVERSEDEEEANAELFAASPQLLAVLNEALEEAGHSPACGAVLDPLGAKCDCWRSRALALTANL